MRLAFAIFAAAIAAAPALARDNDLHAFPLRIGDHGVIAAHIVTTTEGGAGLWGSSRRTEADIDYEYTAEGDGYRITAKLLRYERLWNGRPMATTGSDAEKRLVQAMYPATYTSDSRLTPLRMENWEAIKARIGTATEDIVRLFTEKEGAEMGKTQRAGLKAGFGEFTAESVLSWYARAKLTRTGNDYLAMVRNQAVSTHQDSEWPWEGKMVKVKIEETSTLLQWDPASGTAHVVSDKATMPVDVTPEMRAEWAKRPKRYIDYDNNNWVIHSRCDLDIDLRTGLISKSACNTDDGYKHESGDEMSDTTVITLILKR